MKIVLAAAIAIGLMGIAGVAVLAQSGNDLFQQALVKERTEGNMAEAIKIYETIVQKFGSDRKLAARALVQMGQCYEKLGSAEAQKTYERVLRDYADQRELAAEAGARLSALVRAAGAATAPGIVVRQVWSGPGVDAIESDVSPDGRYLTFVDWSTGGIGIRSLATGENRQLTNKVASSAGSDTYAEFGEWPIVSPDSRQVAYAWLNKDKVPDLRVLSVTAAGRASNAKPRVVFRNEQVQYIQVFAWSADSKQILVLLKGKEAAARIALVSIDSGSVRVLKSLEWRYPRKMSLSPDGRYIAYDLPVRQDSSDRDIFVLSTNGARETVLVPHPGIHHSPVWLPDGRRILFVSDRGGTTGAWMVSVADGKAQGPPELVKPDIGRVIPLRFTRDGSYYYEVVKSTQDIFTATLDPATGKVISMPVRAIDRFVGSNLAPAWSPDGESLAYYSRRGAKGPDSLTLVIRTARTGEEREFALAVNPEGDPYPFPVLRWSSDGRALLVSGTDPQGRWSLHRMDPQSGNVTPMLQNILTAAYPPLRWALSTDGTTAYFARSNEEDKTFSIIAHDFQTGTEKQLYRTRPQGRSAESPFQILALAVSKDGRHLAFVEDPEMPRLQIIPADGGAGGDAREVFRAERPYYLFGQAGIEWTPDGNHVLFLVAFYASPPEPATSTSGLSSGLWRIPVAGGGPEKILAMPASISMPSIHPDGRRLAFTTGSRSTEEVWVMENVLPALKTSR